MTSSEQREKAEARHSAALDRLEAKTEAVLQQNERLKTKLAITEQLARSAEALAGSAVALARAHGAKISSELAPVEVACLLLDSMSDEQQTTVFVYLHRLR